MTVNVFKHREVWLHAVTEQLRPIFAAHDATIPENLRLTCGFPSVGAFAAKHQTVGGMLVGCGQQGWAHRDHGLAGPG